MTQTPWCWKPRSAAQDCRIDARHTAITLPTLATCMALPSKGIVSRGIWGFCSRPRAAASSGRLGKPKQAASSHASRNLRRPVVFFQSLIPYSSCWLTLFLGPTIVAERPLPGRRPQLRPSMSSRRQSTARESPAGPLQGVL